MSNSIMVEIPTYKCSICDFLTMDLKEKKKHEKLSPIVKGSEIPVGSVFRIKVPNSDHRIPIRDYGDGKIYVIDEILIGKGDVLFPALWVANQQISRSNHDRQYRVEFLYIMSQREVGCNLGGYHRGLEYFDINSTTVRNLSQKEYARFVDEIGKFNYIKRIIGEEPIRGVLPKE